MKNEVPKDPNQLDAFKDFGPQKDKEGRTLEDIKNATKSLKPEVLNSIVFKDGKYLIEGIDADEWIATDRRLNGEDPSAPWYKNI
ncbi:MAG: hypothetical protein NT068_02810 [Candidatus Nomurabacteria bacterium]|nr:hypothetical protein [Candidatus Nomurabacteria bacterium]